MIIEHLVILFVKKYHFNISTVLIAWRKETISSEGDDNIGWVVGVKHETLFMVIGVDWLCALRM